MVCLAGCKIEGYRPVVLILQSSNMMCDIDISLEHSKVGVGNSQGKVWVIPGFLSNMLQFCIDSL